MSQDQIGAFMAEHPLEIVALAVAVSLLLSVALAAAVSAYRGWR